MLKEMLIKVEKPRFPYDPSFSKQNGEYGYKYYCKQICKQCKNIDNHIGLL